jgi:hypothetical protein
MRDLADQKQIEKLEEAKQQIISACAQLFL